MNAKEVKTLQAKLDALVDAFYKRQGITEADFCSRVGNIQDFIIDNEEEPK